MVTYKSKMKAVLQVFIASYKSAIVEDRHKATAFACGGAIGILGISYFEGISLI